LNAKAIGGAYEGVLRDGGETLKGTWKQAGVSLPLSLSKTEKPPVVNRPQEPKPPFPYVSEEVRFRNPKAGVELAGTFTKPTKGGPFRTVILISGSGPQDRDESLFGHRPFLVLADYLTRREIAVLRYDDRGFGKSTGDFQSATTADFASDALAAVEYLKSRKDVDQKRIGLAGHSEGALVASMASSASKDVAFTVLLASPGMNGEDLLVLQGRALAKAEGADEEWIKKNTAVQKRCFKAVKETADPAMVEAKLRNILHDWTTGLNEDEKKAYGLSEAAIDAQVKQMISPWFRFFLTTDPAPALQKVTCPVLALWGKKDLQVPPNENVPLVEAALKRGGNKRVVVKVLNNLNHLFQTSGTGSLSEYSRSEETFSPAAMAAVGDWMTALK